MSKLSFLLLCLPLTACSTSPLSTGQANSDEVEAALLSHQDDFRSCYEREPSKAEGRVMAGFTIGSDGRVTTAAVKESTLNRPKVEACVLDTIRGIRFPAPKGGGTVQVSYPFKFHPN